MNLGIYVKLLFAFILIWSCKTNKEACANHNANLFPIGKNGKWGYANENGDLVINYKFEKVTFFKGERAAAKLKGKFGFINKDGEFFSKPKFDSIGYFNDKKANVIKKGKRLTIDKNGKKLNEGIVISTERNTMGNAKLSDYFELIEGKYKLNTKNFENEKRLDPAANFEIVDFTFEKVLPFSWNSFIVKKDNKYDIYLLNSGGLKNLSLDSIEPIRYEWNNSISSQYAKFEDKGKWGIISSNGIVLIDAAFYAIANAQGQYYLVEYKPNHWGYLSQSKKMFK